MPKTIDLDARKASIAEALWQVILQRGIAAVSVRTVAEQAGIVVGSLRHVFPTRAELVTYSGNLMLERASDRIRAIPRASDDRAYVLDVLSNLLPFTPETRAELEINMALLGEATAVPGLVEVRESAHAQIAALCERLVGLMQHSDAPNEPQRTAARRLHAMVDGLAFHMLHAGPNSDPAWVRSVLEAEVDRLLTQRRS